MKRKFTLLAGFILTTNFLNAQCAEVATGASNFSFSALPGDYLGQSFKTTCKGTLTTVKVQQSFASSETSRVFIENASGTVLGELLNQPIISGINTYDFSSKNITLEANTEYRFKIGVVNGMKISGINQNIYPKGNVFLNNNQYTGFDLVNWEVNLAGLMATNEASENEFIKIYPNPAKNEVTVKRVKNESSTYQIFDLQGKIVAKGVLPKSGIIPLKNISAGNYILKVDDNHKSYSEKLIVK